MFPTATGSKRLAEDDGNALHQRMRRETAGGAPCPRPPTSCFVKIGHVSNRAPQKAVEAGARAGIG